MLLLAGLVVARDGGSYVLAAIAPLVFLAGVAASLRGADTPIVEHPWTTALSWSLMLGSLGVAGSLPQGGVGAVFASGNLVVVFACCRWILTPAGRRRIGRAPRVDVPRCPVCDWPSDAEVTCGFCGATASRKR
jgi:hypothetical protein